MTATGDLDARMTEFLTNVGDAMGLQLTVTTEALDDATRVSIEGDECDVFLQNKAEGLDALQEALAPLPRGNWMIEKRIFGRELTVGVLNGQALGIVEVIPKGGIYDYKHKYVTGSTEYRYPAVLPAALESGVRRDAETAFAVCGCRDFARVDFIATQDGPWFLLEVNTIPGLTETSLLPKSASCAGYDFDRLVNELVAPSLKRFQDRGSLERN